MKIIASGLMNTYRIQIDGLVQGVGFRPFIYRLANTLKLSGTVKNRNNGVLIYVNTDQKGLENLIERIEKEAPQHSKIATISPERIEYMQFPWFSIVASGNVSDDITNVGPDIAVCKDCLDDMKFQDHRIGYPLINCTNCGPRFSIIKGVPYDRNMTTMEMFKMCEKCSKEFNDISDRRFHAQPVACNRCGPSYSLQYKNKVENHIPKIISIAARLIEEGSTIALKGTGGFHLICDANIEETVLNLRISKERDGKPFAVMCRDISAVEKIAFLNSRERGTQRCYRSYRQHFR